MTIARKATSATITNITAVGAFMVSLVFLGLFKHCARAASDSRQLAEDASPPLTVVKLFDHFGQLVLVLKAAAIDPAEPIADVRDSEGRRIGPSVN